MMKPLFWSFLYILASAHDNPASHCRCRPHQACWPSTQDWNSLNASIGGALVTVRPVASACHPGDPDADKTTCQTVTDQWTNSTWRAAQPGAVLWENWEALPERNQSCYIESAPGTACGQGRISLYSAAVRSASQIQQVVRFANRRFLRLVIKNSGHCFLGRSVAPESLQILTNGMKGITLVDDFVPAGAPKKTHEGPAVTIEAGVSLQELYTALAKHNRTVVAGAAHTVGAAGGYIQGGGHSFLGTWKGMASDNALEFTVVTAKGDVVTANEHQHRDLFWALRGGGGGTFGVVVSVTLRTFDEVPITLTNLNVTTMAGDPHFWDAMTEVHAAVPRLNDAGGAGYYFLIPSVPVDRNTSASVLTLFLAYPNQTDTAKIDHLYNPLLAKLNSTTGVQTQYASLTLPSVQSLLQNILLLGDHDEAGTISLTGSRLFSRDLLSSTDGAERLVSALRKFDQTPTFIGHIVAGGAVAANEGRVDSALHPAWRKTALHLVFGRGWKPSTSLAEQRAIQDHLTNVDVPLLRSVEGPQAMGAYLNEANGYETNFQESFWGSHYRRLYAIKQKWDPTGLFIVRRGVGSEDWDDEGLCQVSR